MNTFTTAIIAGTLVTLAVGVLLGLLRGMKRSLLRLALLALCLVLSLALCTAVSNSIVSIRISDGKTLEELLTAGFSEGGEAVTDIVIPMVQIFAKIIAFLFLFGLLQFITWVLVYPILKLVLRPILGRKVKSRGIGALVGAVCGALVAFAIYVPMNGLICEVGKLAAIDLSGLSGSSGQSSQLDAIQATGIAEYSETGISKFYSAVGSGFYHSLSTVTDKNGKEVHLSTQIDALSAAADFASKAASLKDVMNGDGTVNTENIKEFAKALSELDELTPEAKKALNEMVSSITDSLGDNVPEAIRNLDLEQIDFKAEGSLLETVADVVEQEGSLENVDIRQVVNDLSKSTVILPALAESNVTLPVDEETKAQVDEAIAELESQTGDDAVDAETIGKLKALFGAE